MEMQQCCKNTRKKSHRYLQRTIASLILNVWLWSSIGLALHHHHDGQIHQDCPFYFFSIAIIWDGVTPENLPPYFDLPQNNLPVYKTFVYHKQSEFSQISPRAPPLS
jgi:hypothetical protein